MANQESAAAPFPGDKASRPSSQETIALLEATLQATFDGILVLDLNRSVIYYNRRFLAMFGLRAEQVDAGLSAMVDLVAESLEDASRSHATPDVFWADAVTEMTDLLRFTDGRVYERFVAPHRVGGHVVGRVATYRDITRTVMTERALEQHRAFLEKAQEVAHIGSWISELDGSGSLIWSPETCRIFGVPVTELAETDERFFSFVHDDDREVVRNAGRAAQVSSQHYDIEHRIIRADGVERWVRERADVIRDARGNAIRLVGTVQDITERRQLEEQLRQAQKLEAIGRLAGGVAHDLNNALTTIVGYTELALNALATEHPARRDVGEIRRAAERAEAVTRQLLAFSRKQVLQPRTFYLHQLVESVGPLLQRLLGSAVAVKTMIDPELPPIHGDPGQIEQAIINLGVNARDAMPDGGRMTLRVSAVDIDESVARAQSTRPGRYVELSVSDDGHGMDHDTRAHIFEPFFTTKEIGKGTGLGLAMVYGTVKQSGGFILVESEVARGTTFRLYFPPGPAPEPVEPAAAPALAVDAPPEPVTILVAEDEPAVRHLVAMALTADGYRVIHAGSGNEALALAEKEPGVIDLLLTDANMPGMSGVELATTLVGRRPGLNVLVMSGFTEDSLRVGEQDGPVALLPKPFTPKELKRKVRDVLDRAR